MKHRRSRRSRVWKGTKKTAGSVGDGLDVADGCCGCLVVGPLVLAGGVATVALRHAVARA